MNIELPHYEVNIFSPKASKYCVCIPIINEGNKILGQLERMKANRINLLTDIILCDGGSTDGSTNAEILRKLLVNTLLVKKGPGKLSAQLRMGYYWALERGYEGIITIDGNGKDSVESIPAFVQALEQGYDMIQGSRYIAGGKAINTPFIRHLAVKLIHVPIISTVSKFKYTDTTNGFRGYSSRYLLHKDVQPFRNIFMTYELIAYLSVRAPQLELKTIEIPVTRAYPPTGSTPTKISFVKGNYDLLRILVRIIFGRYNPKDSNR